MTQNFKGDALELKMQDVANPVFNATDLALNEFYSDGFDCSAFLLMLYDQKRMPFSQRIPRDAFVDFVKEALKQFPVTGTFESYLFVLRSVFGSLSDITFDIDVPGKLSIAIDTFTNSEFDFLGREFNGGAYEFFEMIDMDGNPLIFRGISGINTAYELGLMFSEIMPAGITPDLTIEFFTRSFWVSEESSVFYEMITSNLDEIYFYEIGA
jgi:hypothetical protein